MISDVPNSTFFYEQNYKLLNALSQLDCEQFLIFLFSQTTIESTHEGVFFVVVFFRSPRLALKEEGGPFAIYVTICSRTVTTFKVIFISVLLLPYFLCEKLNACLERSL